MRGSRRREKIFCLVMLGLGRLAWAAEGALTTEQAVPPTEEHWSVHGQATVVPQGHPQSSAAYAGPNSLDGRSELHASITSTLFLGRSLWSGASLYANPEAAGGSGLSGTHGIAAFPNGEIYRVDNPDLKLYVSRVFLRQVFGLGGGQEAIEGGANQLAERLDVRRLTFTAGRFSLNDIFDGNAYAHDPRTQFLNWAFMDNGAWDYAADTRGYTYALVGEYNERDWALRVGAAMLPTSANGMELDSDLAESRALNAELEYRYQLGAHAGKARLLGYANRARMGNYAGALAQTGTPDITTTRAPRTKYGIGLNLEQALTRDVGAFARLGWSDGDSETWTFTEIDRALSFGLSANGRRWGRSDDTLGLAIAIDGLSSGHAAYLRRGGSGFLLGDGGLNYGTETVAEIYYAYRPAGWSALTADYQYIGNPGYNRDRAGVSVISGRLHLEL